MLFIKASAKWNLSLKCSTSKNVLFATFTIIFEKSTKFFLPNLDKTYNVNMRVTDRWRESYLGAHGFKTLSIPLSLHPLAPLSIYTKILNFKHDSHASVIRQSREHDRHATITLKLGFYLGGLLLYNFFMQFVTQFVTKFIAQFVTH